ncbi:MAG: DEAD/DEAH box helicase [Opitutales bacterium]|jgi:superfamily II DNA or RNA helicase
MVGNIHTLSGLDLSDCTFSFGTQIKGKSYFRRDAVREIGSDPETLRIRSTVQGTQLEPYLVELGFEDTTEGLRLKNAICSCPVGFYCKHCVATFLEARKRFPSFPGEVAGGIAENPLLHPSQMDVVRGGELPHLSPPIVEQDLQATLKTIRPAPSLSGNRPGWLDMMEHEIEDTKKPVPDPLKPGAMLLSYSFEPATDDPRAVELHLRRSQRLKSGKLGKGQGDFNLLELAEAGLNFVPESDMSILIRLAKFAKWGYEGSGFLLRGRDGAELVREIIKTGRAGYERDITGGLEWGPPRKATLGWKMNPSGAQAPVLELEGFDETASFLLTATEPTLYLDPSTRSVGEILSCAPPAVLTGWAMIDPVPLDEAALFGAELARRLGAAIPAPVKFRITQRNDVRPLPVIELRACKQKPHYDSWVPRNAMLGSVVPYARIAFRYEGTEIASASREKKVTIRQGDEVTLIARNEALENRYFNSLKKYGLSRTRWLKSLEDDADIGLEDASEWRLLIITRIDELNAAGWTVRLDKSFPYTLADDNSYYEEWTEGEAAHWFEFENGFSIDGKRVSTLPALAEFLNLHVGETLDNLREILRQTGLQVPVDGRTAILPGEPLLPLLDSLFDLFSGERRGDNPPRLKLDGLRACSINAQRGAQLPLRLRELRERLREGLAPRPLDAPEGFRATLREYQKLGNGWLHYLAETSFGGVLADDMGLGKTVQTLAHIAGEKQRGALPGPVLVVAPKSVVHNWEAEARRFTPWLRSLVLQGKDRKEQFDEIAQNDLVLTSYPLIVRDTEFHSKQDYSLIVFDEAQNIKNHRTKTYEAAVEIPARRRLALTGTPVENNLSELWALYSAMQPGILPDHKAFTRHFRTPIEKGGDTGRLALLRERIAPFTLRRTKAAVLADLPPKTESVTMIDLTDRQVELYESVRAAMERRVRDAMAERGLARSQIVVLDALLKLRQVCCDPRLLKTTGGARCTTLHSAKLEALHAQLDELVAEGRRVLVFSQFVEMLELIKPGLAERKIPFLELTGRTENRAELVNRFQSGVAPLFLISLKAGGSGLNLTAADTVIHYDPWWNPAVENQATDRTHRIGQDKPVFVYKLITRGTVEEKILALQKRKSELLAGILSENPEAEQLGLTEEMVSNLLAPIDA